MDKELIKMIIAQQVVILKRLEILECESSGKSRFASIQTYVDELRKEAEKIVDQIRVWYSYSSIPYFMGVINLLR